MIKLIALPVGAVSVSRRKGFDAVKDNAARQWKPSKKQAKKLRKLRKRFKQAK